MKINFACFYSSFIKKRSIMFKLVIILKKMLEFETIKFKTNTSSLFSSAFENPTKKMAAKATSK